MCTLNGEYLVVSMNNLNLDSGPFNHQKLFITGASGFIGKQIVPRLIRDGYDITLLCRSADKARETFPKHSSKIIEFDIAKDIWAAPLAGDTTLLHLAWDFLSDYNSLSHIEECLPQHYRFLKDLVKAGLKGMTVIGTCQEYGPKHGPLNSSTTTDPQTAYALAKDSLRRSLQFLQKKYDFTLRWARLFYIYGDNQDSRTLLGQLDRAIQEGQPTFNMSGGEQLRDYLSVGAVADGVVRIHKGLDSGIFNVCSGNPISVRKLVEQHIEKKGSPIELNLGFYGYPQYEPMAFWGVCDENQD